MTDTAKPTSSPWLRIGTTIYALETAGYRNGEKQYRNRFHADVQSLRTDHEELVFNAVIMQEAGNAYIKTGLTPRQLVEQRDELLSTLGVFWNYFNNPRAVSMSPDQLKELARAAIAKVEAKS